MGDPPTADEPPSALTVLIVSDFAHVNGGAAQVAIQSAVGLKRRGINVVFAYASDPVDERLTSAGITAVRLPFDEVWKKPNPVAAALQGIWNSAAASLFKNILASYDRRHTIVHFHQWTKCLSPSVIAMSLALDFRTIITAHDYFLACPNGALYNFNTNQPCSLTPMTPRCLVANCDSRSMAHKLVRVARQSVQSIRLSRGRRRPFFIHVSEFARKIGEPLINISGKHFTVGNPVLLERLDRASPETNRELLFVGRLVPEKGCIDLALAAHRIGMPVAFAGSGPAYEAILKANPNARMLGWIASTDLRALVRRARALIFPSRWNENSGLVCFEALGNGIPVVASRRTASARLIDNGGNGLLIDPDDHVEFGRALSTLQSDEVVGRMSRFAYRHYWSAPPSMDRHLDELIEVYDDALVPRSSEETGK
jgi:glycosyltransferase involved in cell wall biosynthesis